MRSCSACASRTAASAKRVKSSRSFCSRSSASMMASLLLPADGARLGLRLLERRGRGDSGFQQADAERMAAAMPSVTRRRDPCSAGAPARRGAVEHRLEPGRSRTLLQRCPRAERLRGRCAAPPRAALSGRRVVIGGAARFRLADELLQPVDVVGLAGLTQGHQLLELGPLLLLAVLDLLEGFGANFDQPAGRPGPGARAWPRAAARASPCGWSARSSKAVSRSS